jgi:hypothetical protein
MATGTCLRLGTATGRYDPNEPSLSMAVFVLQRKLLYRKYGTAERYLSHQ